MRMLATETMPISKIIEPLRSFVGLATVGGLSLTIAAGGFVALASPSVLAVGVACTLLFIACALALGLQKHLRYQPLPIRIDSSSLEKYLLLCMALTVSWPGIWRGPFGLRISDIFVILLAAGLLQRQRLSGHPHLVMTYGAFGLLLLGSVLSFGGALSADTESLSRGLFVIVFMPLVLAHYINSRSTLQMILIGLVISAAVSSVFAIMEEYAGVWVLPFRNIFVGVRAYGLSVHPTVLGLTCATAVPAAIALFVSQETRNWRMPIALCGALILVGLALSASRGPLLGLAAGGAVFGLCVLPTRFAMPTVGIFSVGLAFAVVLSLAFPQYIQRLTDDGASKSSGERVTLYHEAFEDVATSPFVGDGAGTIKGDGLLTPNGNKVLLAIPPGFSQAYDVWFRYAVSLEGVGSHNIWLQTWQALGLVGLAGLILAAGNIVVAGLRLASEAASDILVAALLSGLVASLSATFFYSVVFDRQVWAIPSILLAVSVQSLRNSGSHPVTAAGR